MKSVPQNFGHVEEGIFRCGLPEPRNYSFLTSLGLRTCIILSDTRDEAFIRWLTECGVRVVQPLSQQHSSSRGSGGPATAKRLDDSAEGGDNAGGPSIGASNNNNNNNNTSNNNININSADGDGLDDTGTYDVADTESLRTDQPQPSPPGALHNSSMPTITEERSGATTTGAGGGGTMTGSPHSTLAPSLSAPGSNVERFLKEHRTTDRLYAQAAGGGGGGGGGGGAMGAFSPVVVRDSHTSSSAFTPALPQKTHHESPMSLPEYVVVEVLQCLVDPVHYPVLVTCSRGRYRTGLVCGCLRKLQRWNLVSILEEYRRFAGDKRRADNEEFIEYFYEGQVSLELPDGRRPTILYHHMMQ